MGATTIYGLPYQGLTDPPHGPDLGQNLAEAVETELSRIDADVAALPGSGTISGSRIATTVVAAGTADSASITTTETSIGSVTASLVSGRTYRIRYVTRIGASVANDVALVRIRENTVAGTELVGDNFLMFTTGSAGQPAVMEGEYTASATGSKTFHLTLQRAGGTGNVRRESSFMPTYIYVDYIRG